MVGTVAGGWVVVAGVSSPQAASTAGIAPAAIAPLPAILTKSRLLIEFFFFPYTIGSPPSFG